MAEPAMSSSSSSSKAVRVSSRKVIQGRETAERLLGIARRIFEEKGFAATTTQEVIEEAGVTKGALYHHFPSKLALFEAVYRTVEDEMAAEIQEASSRSKDPFERLVAGCFAYLECASDNRMHRILRTDGPSALGLANWQMIDREYSVYRLLPFLKQLSADGVLRTKSVEAFAFQLTGAMNEATFWIAHHKDPAKALRESKRELRSLLEGVRQ